MNTYFGKSTKLRRSVFAASLFAGAAFTASPALAGWFDSHPPFNPHQAAPEPYDPTAIGRSGASYDSGSPSDCYWSREQTYVGGRLVWRPLQVCPYPRD